MALRPIPPPSMIPTGAPAPALATQQLPPPPVTPTPGASQQLPPPPPMTPAGSPTPGAGQQFPLPAFATTPGAGQQFSTTPGVGQQFPLPAVATTPSASQQFPLPAATPTPAARQQFPLPAITSTPSAGQQFPTPPPKIPAVIPPPSTSQQLISKRDLSGPITITMSDDSVMMKQIKAIHAPDGREFDVRPLLQLVEDILTRATPQFDAQLSMVAQVQEEVEDKAMQTNLIAMIEALSYVIDRIACEISYKALGGSDPHTTTVGILSMLASYTWDAKLVLTMAAFALTYGEFWLLSQIYTTNQLAKSMAILKQLPSIIERGGPLKARFDAINKLIKAMVDVTRCVVAIRELPSSYISNEVPALSAAMAHVPAAVYWTTRSIVLCANHIHVLTTIGIESTISATESWELSSSTHKLNTIYEHLYQQLQACQRYIEDKRNQEAYQKLKELIQQLHLDNMKILKALIYARDEIQPLFDGSTKKKVNIEVLRRRNVLLLISGLDISAEELSILEQIYNDSRIHPGRLESQFEVVWVPIVDRSVQWTEAMQKQFEILQSTMTWYTVSSPLLIEKPIIRFIREEWHFRNKPILVVLDPQGRVVSPNAIHMMWIWGSSAFPFTSTREESLWKEEMWRLELLVDSIDQTILNWIREDKYTFLYGGDDIEWARKFTTTARMVAQASSIPLEMVYVGKSTKKEAVRRVTATIAMEKLSYCWQDPSMVWFFWTRLHSMLFSKIQLGQVDDRDVMMQEIKRVLSHDKEGSWAILSKGSSVLVSGHGATVVTTLVEYDLWKDNVPVKGFDTSFQEHHKKVHGIAHPCSRFEFSTAMGRIPENLRCPECHRTMERLTTFKCCHEETIPTPDYL